MTLPAPSVAATPAAVPAVSTPASPAATPANQPASTPPAADTKSEGRGSRIFSMLAEESNSEPGKPREAKKPDAPAAGTPAATPAATAPVKPAADDKPIRATKTAPISKRPAPPKDTPAAPVAPAASAAAPAKVDNWESELVDEEKQMIADAEEAEKHLPTRKGLAAQTKKFVKEHAKYVETHPDIETDPDEKAAYESFLSKNRPRLTDAEQRQVSESRIAAQVAKPFEEKTANLEHQLFVRDEEPKIAQQRQRVASELNAEVMPEEIMEFARKHGTDVARKEFADELKVVTDTVATATSDYEELIRLDTFHPTSRRPLATPATSQSDPKFAQHQRLISIVEKVDSDFKENAKQSELLRDGKWFCTREEWASGFNKFPDQYWHFTNREIGTRMLAWVKPAVQANIAATRASLEGRGYVKRPFTPAASAPAAVAAEPTRTPAGPGASPAPSSVPGATAPTTTGGRLAAALTRDQ